STPSPRTNRLHRFVPASVLPPVCCAAFPHLAHAPPALIPVPEYGLRSLPARTAALGVCQGRGGLDGAGLAKWDASMATFGSTDVSSYVDRPSSQVTVHLNGILTPDTSR